MKKKITAKKFKRKNETEAYSKVLAILEPFPDESKLRIIKATAILLGIPV